MSLAIVILAAGQGTRMNTNQPKVLHTLAGKSLLSNVLFKALELNPVVCTIVYGHQGKKVINSVKNEFTANSKIDEYDKLFWVHQAEQLGTGHALITALQNSYDSFKSNNVKQVLVLNGDVPLVNLNDLNSLKTTVGDNQLGIITLRCSNPYGLGRIIRTNARIAGIVEEKDATEEQKLIPEVNTGIFLLPYPKVNDWLSALKTNNAQSEYYLTDVVDLAVKESFPINSVTVSDQASYKGINTLCQLAEAERHYQSLTAISLMDNGVKIVDPNRIDIRGELSCSTDVHIDVNCIFEGNVTIGSNSYIEPNCILRNVNIGENCYIKSNTVIEDSNISDGCNVGPFARVRPGTFLEEGVQVGNFVEIKKSTLGKGTKANHLSYIGDATVGSSVNIGAGTITCNYDGVNKYQTTIGDNAFIGSNSSLIAPVSIGSNAIVGAGSIISKDAPDDKLTLARSKQVTIDNYKRKDKAS